MCPIREDQIYHAYAVSVGHRPPALPRKGVWRAQWTYKPKDYGTFAERDAVVRALAREHLLMEEEIRVREAKKLYKLMAEELEAHARADAMLMLGEEDPDSFDDPAGFSDLYEQQRRIHRYRFGTLLFELRDGRQADWGRIGEELAVDDDYIEALVQDLAALSFVLPDDDVEAEAGKYDNRFSFEVDAKMIKDFFEAGPEKVREDAAASAERWITTYTAYIDPLVERVDVNRGRMFQHIRDDELFRVWGFDTFTAYAESDHSGCSRQHVYRMIKVAKAHDKAIGEGLPPPPSERSMRPKDPPRVTRPGYTPPKPTGKATGLDIKTTTEDAEKLQGQDEYTWEPDWQGFLVGQSETTVGDLAGHPCYAAVFVIGGQTYDLIDLSEDDKEGVAIYEFAIQPDALQPATTAKKPDKVTATVEA